MKITNVRRGRILRIVSICAIVLFFIYILRKWTSEDVAESQHAFLEGAAVGSYRSHKGVYPKKLTGKYSTLGVVGNVM